MLSSINQLYDTLENSDVLRTFTYPFRSPRNQISYRLVDTTQSALSLSHFWARSSFSTKFQQGFLGLRNPNPMSDGRKYVVDFLTNEGLLDEGINYRQSLTTGFRRRGIRIRCQMVQIVHFIFSVAKHFWVEIRVATCFAFSLFFCSFFAFSHKNLVNDKNSSTIKILLLKNSYHLHIPMGCFIF